jgi:hypothetical protein
MLKKSVAKELNFAKPPEKREGADVWRTADGETALALVAEHIILGDAASVDKCLKASSQPVEDRLGQTRATIATYGTEIDPTARLVEVLGERRNEETPLNQTFRTETNLNQNGIDRVTTSDFGLLGMIIQQFRSE